MKTKDKDNMKTLTKITRSIRKGNMKTQTNSKVT